MVREAITRLSPLGCSGWPGPRAGWLLCVVHRVPCLGGSGNPGKLQSRAASAQPLWFGTRAGRGPAARASPWGTPAGPASSLRRAVRTGSCGGVGPAPRGRADHRSPPPPTLCSAGGVTSDPWPGPRPEERLASSCSTSSSCRGSLNRINLLENGDHCSLGARSPRAAAPRPGRRRALEFGIGDRGGEGGGGAPRGLRACRGKPAMPAGDQPLEGRLRLPAAPEHVMEARGLGQLRVGPVCLQEAGEAPPPPPCPNPARQGRGTARPPAQAPSPRPRLWLSIHSCKMNKLLTSGQIQVLPNRRGAGPTMNQLT